jgi:TorA maturation chaperone TorD
MVADLSKALSLNEEQGSRIEQIFVSHFEEVKEKMDAGKPDRKVMEAIKTKFENEVNELLTEEQQKLFVAFRENNAPPHKESHEHSKE